MAKGRRKLCYGVMILSALALCVDRFVLSDGVTGPETAEGATGDPAALLTEVPPQHVSEALSIPELPFPHDVKRFTFGRDIPDLFSPPAKPPDPELKPLTGNGDNTRDEEPDQQKGMGRSAFEAAHDLGGMLDHERLRIAIIDGLWLRIGDELDGCTLSSIVGDAAHFTCHDGEAVLTPIRHGRRKGD